MAKKKTQHASAGEVSTKKPSGASTSAGKGRPTPKRNASRNATQNVKAKSSNLQWFIIVAVLAAIVIAVIVLGTVYGDPYDPLEYLEADSIRRQEELRGG